MGFIREVTRDGHKWVTCACGLGRVHALVDVKHECMKMNTLLVNDAGGQGIIEKIHEHGLSSANIAVEV